MSKCGYVSLKDQLFDLYDTASIGSIIKYDEIMEKLSCDKCLIYTYTYQLREKLQARGKDLQTIRCNGYKIIPYDNRIPLNSSFVLARTTENIEIKEDKDKPLSDKSKKILHLPEGISEIVIKF
jgi:hypothetical protein